MMMKKLLITLVSGLLALHTMGAQAETLESFEAADQINLVPSPRQISLDPSRRVDLDGFTIRIGDDQALLRSAGEELNRKLRLGGAPELPIGVGPVEMEDIILITAAGLPGDQPWGERLDIDEDDPGEQGYGLGMFQDGSRRVIAVVGSDVQGAFYGVMTLWHMISVEGGEAFWTTGQVRDWPAFRRRALGHLGQFEWITSLSDTMSEEEFEDHLQKIMPEAEAKARWLALNKINYAYLVGDRVSSPDPQIQREDRLLGEVSRMALERFNIRTRRTWGTHINEELEEGEWLDCVMRGKARHCWSADHAHQRHADNLTFRSVSLGLTNFVLHAVDGGRLDDPEWWSRRCDRCRTVYGDDHARAAAEQFNRYYELARAALPDMEYEAVIWPYHFQWAVDGFAEHYDEMTAHLPHQGMIRGLEDSDQAARVIADLKAYHAALNKALPADMLITFREGGPREFAAAAALHDRHPLNIWIYWGRTEGMQPLFFPQARFMTTWLRPDADDQVHTEKFRRLDLIHPVVSNEYAWNPSQPDAEPTFETVKRLYAVGGRDVTDYQRHSLIPRICAGLWGDVGARYMFFFAHTLALRYFADPEMATNKAFDAEAQDDPYVFMPEQLEAMRANLPGLDPLIAHVEAGDYEALSGGPLYRTGIVPAAYLIAYGNLAWVKGEVEWGLEQARRLMAGGDAEAAGRALDALEARLPQITERQARIQAAFASMPDFKVYARGEEAQLWNFDINAHKPLIGEMRKRLGGTARVGLPEHLAEDLEIRQVEVARQDFRNAFEADGLRGEGRWMQTRPVEFLTVNGERLTQYPTRCWLVYDDEALYVLTEMMEPARPLAHNREHDGEVWQDDAFELFLTVDAKQTEPIQVALNAAGDRFDYHPKQGGKSWNPNYEAGVRVGDGLWAVELRLPFGELGVEPPAPGEAWGLNISRTRLPKPAYPERESSNIIGFGNNWAVDRYVPMQFLSETRTGMPPSPEVIIEEMARTNKTTEYGYATILTFRPEIISHREIWNAKVALQVIHEGKVVAESLHEEDSIPGLWRPSRLMGLDLGQAYDGPLRLIVEVESDSDQTQLKREFIISVEGEMHAADSPGLK